MEDDENRCRSIARRLALSDQGCHEPPRTYARRYVIIVRVKLEDLQATAAVRGILTDALVTVVSVRPHPPGDRTPRLRHREPRPGSGRLRFIEVKGRVHDADTITVTRNEIRYSLSKPDDYRLAIVEFLDGDSYRVHYVRHSFHREPDFGANSVNCSFKNLLARAEPPS